MSSSYITNRLIVLFLLFFSSRNHIHGHHMNSRFFVLILSFSWHDAGTYDVTTKTGGPNGSIRHEEEYLHGANAGLKIAIDLCGKPASSEKI